MKHHLSRSVWVAWLLALASGLSQAQMMNFGAVKATGAKPLSADEVRALVTDAQTRFLHTSGGERRWRNAPTLGRLTLAQELRITPTSGL